MIFGWVVWGLACGVGWCSEFVVVSSGAPNQPQTHHQNNDKQEFRQRKQAERAAAKKDKPAPPTPSSPTPEGEESGEEKEGEAEAEEEDEEEEEIELDEATEQRLREEEEELRERLRINPNAFLPLEGVEDEGDQKVKDEEQVRVLGRFLWNEALPAYLEQVSRPSQCVWLLWRGMDPCRS